MRLRQVLQVLRLRMPQVRDGVQGATAGVAREPSGGALRRSSSSPLHPRMRFASLLRVNLGDSSFFAPNSCPSSTSAHLTATCANGAVCAQCARAPRPCARPARRCSNILPTSFPTRTIQSCRSPRRRSNWTRFCDARRWSCECQTRTIHSTAECLHTFTGWTPCGPWMTRKGSW